MTDFELNKSRQELIATCEKELIKKEKSLKKLELLLGDYDNMTLCRRRKLAELKASIQVIKNKISFTKDVLAGIR